MQVFETSEVNFSPLSQRYTLEELWALPEREDHAHYNLIAGILFIVPPPTPAHGYAAARMSRLFVSFLIANNIQGHTFHPPEPICRGAEGSTYLEPDMMYVSKELREQMGPRCTSADIVFECLSPNTSVYDRTTKADTYLVLGVRELWLVDPVTATIEVRYATERDDTPVWERWRFSRGGYAKSRVLEGWEVSVEDLFAGLTGLAELQAC